MTRSRLGILVVLVSAAAAGATDVPIAGRRVAIGARRPASRTFVFRSAADAAIAPPFADPSGGAALRVFVSSGPGQCHAEIRLPAAAWSAIRGDGAGKGWRYRDPRGAAQGVRSVTIARGRRGGRVAVVARGAFPCGLEAAQAAPVHVELRVADARYCAAFVGRPRVNARGRFRAGAAPAPAACLPNGVTVADLNVLHGLFCPPDTAGCRRADRLALVRDFVVARGCPDVLAFQEVFRLSATSENADTLASLLANACPAPYAAIYHAANTVDDEMILSRYAVLDDETHRLYGPLRNVLRVRIDHPIGALDVYATHLSSGSDGATAPCEGTFGPCPAACVAAGATTVRDCQAVQLRDLVAETHDVATPALVVGDMNEAPSSFVYAVFANAGWRDAQLDAGLAECDPATGAGCTSGRIDDALTDMESPAPGQTERIDYVWLVPAGPASLCSAAVEPAGDPDGDGVATRLFADVPNPFGAPCGAAPAPICWASDHTGVQADVSCTP